MQHRILTSMCVIAVLAALTTLRHGRLAAQSPASAAKSPHPLILQENEGEHLLRRPGGPIAAAAASVPEFIIKVDEQNGNAEDFLVSTEIMSPGGVIPFHKHLNSEEILVLEEGGATVTVGELRGIAGPHSVVFIPRDTWVSVTNTGKNPIHIYGIFSRQGFENFFRARSVHPGEPLIPLTPEEVRGAAAKGHAMVWDTSKGPYPPGVAHP